MRRSIEGLLLTGAILLAPDSSWPLAGRAAAARLLASPLAEAPVSLCRAEAGASPVPSPGASASALPSAAGSAAAPAANAPATGSASAGSGSSSPLIWLWIVIGVLVLIGLIVGIARASRRRSAAAAGWQDRVVEVYAESAALCDSMRAAETPGALAAWDADARWSDIQRRADGLTRTLYALREAAPDEDERARVSDVLVAVQGAVAAMDAERGPGGEDGSWAQNVHSRLRAFAASVRALRAPGGDTLLATSSATRACSSPWSARAITSPASDLRPVLPDTPHGGQSARPTPRSSIRRRAAPQGSSPGGRSGGLPGFPSAAVRRRPRQRRSPWRSASPPDQSRLQMTMSPRPPVPV